MIAGLQNHYMDNICIVSTIFCLVILCQGLSANKPDKSYQDVIFTRDLLIAILSTRRYICSMFMLSIIQSTIIIVLRRTFGKRCAYTN